MHCRFFEQPTGKQVCYGALGGVLGFGITGFVSLAVYSADAIPGWAAVLIVLGGTSLGGLAGWRQGSMPDYVDPNPEEIAHYEHVINFRGRIENR